MSVLFRSDGWVKTAQGPAVPGAQIFVCTQPASAPSPLTLQLPAPSPLASIFADPNGLVPITQPIITDGFGHYDFYVAAGTYTVLVYLSGVLQQTYPDQSIGGIGSGGGTGLTAGSGISIVGSTISSSAIATFKTNGVLNGSQTLLNLTNGAGVSITDDGSGDIAFTVTAGATWKIGSVVGPSGTNYSQLGTNATEGGFGSPSTSFNAPTATEPASATFTNTSASAGSYNSFYDQLALITLGLLTDFKVRVTPIISNACFAWIGLTDNAMTPGGTTGTTWNAANPAVNFVGFKYAGANWKAYTSTDATHFTESDTGVAIDITASHLFEIQISSGTAKFLIDGTQVAQISTNLPSVGTVLRWMTMGVQHGGGSGNTGVTVSNWAWSASK